MKRLGYIGAGAIVLLGVLGVASVALSPTSALREQVFSKPCSTPLAYTVGSIDPKFGESKEALVAALQEASSVWNEAAGKQVLAYRPEDPNAIPVHLVYDERQQTIALGEQLDSQKATLDAKRAEIARLDAIYTTAKNTYETARVNYEASAAAYQADVAQVNSAGGATPKQYAQLKARETKLKQDQETLNAMADSLNGAGKDLQTKVTALNESVKAVNSVVSFFNSATDKDFDAGRYVRTASTTKITIYSFSSRKELVFELSHELGHALGMDHNDNPDSIMYAYAKAEVLKVSPEDLASLQTACALN